MWKRCATLIVLACWLNSGPAEAEPSPELAPVTKEAVRQAIATFQKDPVHQQNSGIRLTILRFAHDSDDVSVTIGLRPVPWLENKQIREEDRTNLLTAYVVGNVRSQLDQGKAQNDSLAGCEQVIVTYRQLQKAEPGLVVPEVDNLIDLQKRGKLAAYLEEQGN